MPSRLPIGANDYYDPNPETRHSAGDIWVNLPTYGLLGMRRRAGIVITPPCDLAQGKVETITYLPIISLSSYFSTSAFLPVVMRELRGQLTSLQINELPIANGRFSLPPMEAIIRVKIKLDEIKSGQKSGEKEKTAATKAAACLEILNKIQDGELSDCRAQTVCEALGQKSAKNCYDNLIRNSHAIDLHFLPKDGQPTEWSAIAHHSLVLFRYPITAPVELFDEAQEVGNRDWPSAVARVAKRFQPQRHLLRHAP